MTVTTVISIVSAVLTILRLFLNYAQQKQWIDAGTAEATLQGLKDADDAISRAKKARELVRASNDRDPASIVRDDDGFKRSD